MLKKTRWLLKEIHLRTKYMLSNECIFCKIISGKIPSKRVLENKYVIAINDINPVAQVHLLVIPKVHIESVMTIADVDAKVIIEMHKAAARIVEDKKLEAFRLAYNGGKYQHVGHLHMHLVAGKTVQWSKL